MAEHDTSYSDNVACNSRLFPFYGRFNKLRADRGVDSMARQLSKPPDFVPIARQRFFRQHSIFLVIVT